MKKLMLILVIALTFKGFLYAQEYKVSKNTGRLEIREVNHVTIEGHGGNEIVFSSTTRERLRDERAQGLRAISSLGLEDNSGLGLSVVEKGNVIEVHQLKKTEGPKIKILVPKGVTVSYIHSSPYGQEIQIQNFDGEVEVSTVHNGVVLTNTSGPLTIKTVHGDIDASLGTGLKAPVRLESVHGHVDLALPADAKVNLTMRTNRGEMLVDPDLKIEIGASGEFVNYSDKISGTLNGGGTAISLSSNHDNVYVRKK